MILWPVSLILVYSVLALALLVLMNPQAVEAAKDLLCFSVLGSPVVQEFIELAVHPAVPGPLGSLALVQSLLAVPVSVSAKKYGKDNPSTSLVPTHTMLILV